MKPSDAGGTTFVFGDNVDTDALAPGTYMKRPIEEQAQHCLESLDPAFAKAVRPGDVVAAGRAFGIGSSREQAAQALRHLGVQAVVAKSFGGIFYRNALNLGLLVVACAEVDQIRAGDRVSVDGLAGTVTNHSTGAVLACDKVPAHLLAIVGDGG
ncbi:MAG: 3-isopropylmalate dehydratase, partial [Alphaproteobacteria bacterium]|nr:3-isopropylmalate dehydratase [Alphaproteobacteria bacterium]